MGGLLELIISFGFFSACLAGGVLAIYSTLSDANRLYEPQVNLAYELGVAPRSGVSLELSSRRDATAYAALVNAAKNYGGSACNSYNISDFTSSIEGKDFSGSQFGSAARTVLTTSGDSAKYVVTFRQLASYSSASADFGTVNSAVSSQLVIAQLRRGEVSRPGPLLAEALVRCSVSKL